MAHVTTEAELSAITQARNIAARARLLRQARGQWHDLILPALLMLGPWVCLQFFAAWMGGPQALRDAVDPSFSLLVSCSIGGLIWVIVCIHKRLEALVEYLERSPEV